MSHNDEIVSIEMLRAAENNAAASRLNMLNSAGGKITRDGNCWCAISSEELGPNAIFGYSERSQAQALEEWANNFYTQRPVVPMNEKGSKNATR